MLEFLLEIIQAESQFLKYFHKDTWTVLMDSVFLHNKATMLHNLVFKIILLIFKSRNEHLIVNVVIC